jgi:predicted regulator of Ras-like GTPase activity (Roadblock/LC7/MglB family)
MQAVLTQINSVPGIVGSMLCDEDGKLAAHIFPPLFDSSLMSEAAAALADSALGLQSATGTVELIDLRYNDARIVVKTMPQSFLILLCTKAVNMQLLTISLNVAIKKLEKLFAAYKVQEQAVPVAAPVPVVPVPEVAAPRIAAPPPALQPGPVAIAGSREMINGVTLTVQAMKNTANTYWDNMVEMVSINKGTSVVISDHFKTGGFRKVKLTNPANGKSKKFPVHIIKDDAERLFEGKAVVSLASMEILGVNSGDPVVAQVEVGGGMFGWEGI